MRVLHLYAGNMYGGIERMLVTLARERSACAEMQPEFGLCFEGQLSQELREAGVPVHMLGNVRFSRPWTVWRARRNLAALLRRERFDSVICHACWPHALFARTVRFSHTSLAFWAHDLPSGTNWLESVAARTPPDVAIANSNYTRGGISNLFAAVRSEVIYCPVSPPEQAGRRSTREKVRREMESPAKSVVVLIASRLERWKGHLPLITALSKMPQEEHWECWIAGGAQRPEEQKYLMELRAAAARHGIAGRTKFLGHRVDVDGLFAAADIHCQPNTGPEPFGVAYIEAMYAGLPVVATALGAAPEIVTSETGLLVSPGKADALADALFTLVSDSNSRTRYSRGGPQRAAQLCSPGRQLTTLRDVLNQSPRRREAA
jgi:glycosyltransferase involved in cell wall biosynthesis